jgi:hypothetical protein
MRDCPILHKFPEGSANRDYDIFEQLPDGANVWRTCVVGMQNVELKLRELARESNNKFFAINLQDRTQFVVRSLKPTRRQELLQVS